ncbi:PTS transporter subunit EIIC [Paenibacillus sp. N1-5-1-14]|uniref:PTS transporter subunit EIIC n=1 Tax=Paenibacillus radicibacter TaxID=2972488 RepID=UPI0021591BAA|nr:PTS transporter subunit EIIC [Paenibacillus radicibacter]MCR8643702.1 PTS transporter subunit EIIC [Paenibacillus radicibacter]
MMKLRLLGFLQTIARSLMIPIAVLPASAILQRIGRMEFEHSLLQQIAKVCHAGGEVIFDNLPLLFAIGIAIGFTAGDGIAALSATVGYMVFAKVLANYDIVDATGKVTERLDMGVLGGMMTGLIVAYYYRNYKNIRLPAVLGFFGGKRFIPIITSLTMVLVGVGMGFIWPTIQQWIRIIGMEIVSAGGTGVFIYGFLNRLLIPTGLHHIINSISWFQIGEYTGATGDIVHGDMARFFAGDPSAGMFMTGFFPIMMFGLPAAAFAMMKFVHKDQRKIVVPLLLSAGLTSFFTGVTEPIEFTFMFAAPVLYVVHALLTGIAMVIVYLLDIRLGFGFSAGLIDFVLNWNLASRPALLLAVGVCYSVMYYVVFLVLIRLFRFRTPGREFAEDSGVEVIPAEQSAYTIEDQVSLVLRQVGGMNNIVSVDACITRLRLKLKYDVVVHEVELKRFGAFGVMQMGSGSVHIVFGTDSELIKDSIEKRMSTYRVGGLV